MWTSGLYDKADIIQFSEEIDDGYSGMKKVPYIVKRNYSCRKTRETSEIYRYLKSYVGGMGRVDPWYVIGVYDSDIKEHMILRFKNVRGVLEDYEIVKVEEQKNAFGSMHHLKMMVEKVTGEND